MCESAFRGRSRFVCWNITRVSLCLLCNVHFVQSTQRTRLLRDLADLKARIISVVKNIDEPMLTRVWQELEYRTDVRLPCHLWCTHRTSLVAPPPCSIQGLVTAHWPPVALHT
jgi:hypothetical protein